jgi:hypothetical protein
MAAVGALTVLLIFTVAEKPAEASACCQTCEANEGACYAGCNQVPEGDARTACQNDCYYELYERPSACYLHCSYCGASNPPTTVCYTCTASWYFDGDTVVWVSSQCSLGGSGNADQGSACTTW